MSKWFISQSSPRAVLEWMLKRPLLILLVVAGITLFFLWQLPKLSFRTSIYDLIIEDLDETVRYHEFRQVFGSDEIIRIVVRAESVFDPKTFHKIADLSKSAGQIKGVRRVISLPSIKDDVDTAGKWNLEQFRKLVAPIALFEKNLLATDQKATVITLVLDADADNASVISNIQAMLDATSKDLSLYQIGMPLVSQALVRYTEKDFFRLTPITLLLIIIILFFLLRSFVYIFIPFLCVVLTLLWTFGFLALLRVPISMLTLIVPIFLIAVGTAYCLHVICEYLSSTQRADSPADAVRLTFANITLPSTLAVITTSIGLGSLLVNRIVAIHEFALFACFGMFSLLFLLLVFFPCALVLVPLSGRKEKPFQGDGLIQRLLERIVALSILHQRRTFLCLAGIFLFCGAGLFFVRVETNPIGFLKGDTPVSRNFHDIYRDLSGSFPIHVVMESKNAYGFETPQAMADMARLQRVLESLPGVDKTVSFADYLKLVNYALNRYDPKRYALPQEDFEARLLINNYKSMLGDDMLRRFMSPDLSKANILLLTHLSSSRQFLQSKAKILAHAEGLFSDNYSWDVTGFGVVVAASSHLLVRGQIKSFSITIALIFGIMLLLFVSIKVGLIAIVPNCFPVVITFGLMGWLGIDLSVVTSLIASVAIGLAVDDTIHYLVRYNREFKKDLDKDRALRDTLFGVGRPIIFTTLTVTLGFSVLIFSFFKPTAVFGLLMVITLLAALVGDLILLPALMLHVELVTAWDLLKLMPTVGGVSSATVHELNQPLNAIKMGSEYLKMMVQQGKPVHTKELTQVASEIGDQVDRVSAMINRLQAIGANQGFAKKKIDINQAIRLMAGFVGQQLRLDNISLQLELDESIPLITGHQHRLEQLIYNLITNAWEAINSKAKLGSEPSAGKIVIRSVSENERVAVSINDAGIGIALHLQERILEPFFTTKEPGKGRGLGLSICHEIVKDHGGRLEIRSQAGKGSTFKFSLPVG